MPSGSNAPVREHFFSRSARETDDTCRRMRYWSTVHNGRGLSPAIEARELLVGTALHWALARMWSVVKYNQDFQNSMRFSEVSYGSIDAHLQELREFQRLGPGDQWLVRCLFRAYVVHVLPRYLGEWNVLHVEKELRLSRDFLVGGRKTLLCQPDVILQHRGSRRVRYLEYKTTKLLTANYIDSWRYSPQLAAGKAAAQDTLGLDIDEAVMGFFDKGHDSHNGEYWARPFTNYWEKANADGTRETHAKRPQNWRVWTRFSPQERYQSPADWVGQLPVEVILGQMPESMPVEVDDRLVWQWVDESFAREDEIGRVHVSIASAPHGHIGPSWAMVRATFPHNFRQCRPVIGRTCPFLDLCWNSTLEADPTANGLFVPRVPHHRAERDAMGIEDVE